MAHHRRGLRREGLDEVLSRKIEDDWRAANLDDKRKAMLTYAEKLTRTPSTMTADDVAALRAVGFGDADVLAIAECTAYYAFANRISDGLGVTLEGERP